ncbi:TetR/AcrR family transcriptional regulator [Ruania halotolerans]|uniref:TetR/AcrR family transcriptional regulator n=1 Tax=Ruania halotolerans TaxID=2897773 RepID=UPI001E3A0FA8|nr:TetR/AcrR family transcriptional regulator [Ruania halotolerans]UFU05240.1 TetR/AcrR family transcriptional regulator [Ruania halotolerans]
MWHVTGRIAPRTGSNIARYAKMHAMQNDLGLRERKKIARRDALIDATHELIREQGLENVTVEAICEQVGVSVRTFFNYFESKMHAALGAAPLSLDPEMAASYTAGGPQGDFAADTRTLLAHLLDHPFPSKQRMAAVIEIVKCEPTLVTHHMAIFEAARKEVEGLIRTRLGLPESDSLPELYAMNLFHLARWSTSLWHDAGGAGHPRDHIDRAYADLRTLIT